jgi:electron transport complex protein RnfG
VTLLGAISRNGLWLGAFAAMTTLAIVWTERDTRDAIIASERAAEARQLLEIFPKETHDNSLIDEPIQLPANDPLLNLRQSRSGYIARREGRVVGVILPTTARDGYSGDIRFLVGIRVDGTVAGVRAVSHRETPGLGDKVDLKKSPWILGFNNRSLNTATRADWFVRKDGGVFDQFTGATITPRASVAAVRRTLEYVDLHRDQLFETVAGTGDSYE